MALLTLTPFAVFLFMRNLWNTGLSLLLLGSLASVSAVDLQANTGSSPALKLTIAASPPAGVRLTWPQTSLERVLEQTESLAPPISWKPVEQSVTVSSNLNTVTLTNDAVTRFYRLKGVVDIAQIMRDHGMKMAMDLPLAVSITNAYPDFPFLDNFNPTLLGPLSLVPGGVNGTRILFPGLWEIELESYCLKTGTLGPSEGDGYLPNAFAGPRADIIQKILLGLTPESAITQESAQILLWAVILRTPLNLLPPEAQAAAHQLLSAEDLQHLEAAVTAKDALEDEYATKMIDAFLGPGGLFKDLPLEIRNSWLQGNQFEQSLRESASLSYESIQGLAFAPEAMVEVLTGPQREIPRGRWAWIPSSPTKPYGFLVRYLPFFYDTTTVQICVPEDLAIEADALGRITAIEDGQGQRIETTYDETLPPLEFVDDAGVRAYAFKSIRFVGPSDPEDPRKLLQATKGGLGWTLVGVPSTNQTSTAGSGRYVNANQRYAWAAARVLELSRLDIEFTRVHPGRPAVAPGITANLVNLASYCEGLRQAMVAAFPEEDPQSPLVPDRLGLAYRAWISQLTGFCVGNPGSSGAGLSAALPREGEGGLGMMAAVGLSGSSSTGIRTFSFDSLFFWRKPKPAPKPVTSSYYEYTDNLNWGIPTTYVNAGGFGTQNLGVSNRKTQQAQQKATENYKWVWDASGKWVYVVDKAHSFMGVPAPWVVPLEFVNFIIDGTVDLFYLAGSVLGVCDPPRDDFTTLAVPKIVDPGPITPGPDISPERLQAARLLLEADLRLAGVLHAAVVSYERQAGAVRAGNVRWSVLQAALVVQFQREAALAMLDTADALERWVAVVFDEGVEDVWLEKAEYPVIKERFRAGFQAERIAALHQLGLRDEEIERCRQGYLSLSIQEDALSVFETTLWVSQALRATGRQLMTLPVVTVAAGITP
jgi:hypothetical protein